MNNKIKILNKIGLSLVIITISLVVFAIDLEYNIDFLKNDVLMYGSNYKNLIANKEEIDNVNQKKNPPLFCAQKEVTTQSFKNNPQTKQRQENLKTQWVSYNKNKEKNKNFRWENNAVVTLPIVVHIIHNNGSENISDAKVEAGIQHLNEAFANIGYYDPSDGVDTKIQFCLAQRDPSNNLSNGITRNISPLTNMTSIDDDDLSVKNLNRWDPNCYINIWLVNSIPGGTAGYAYLPFSHGLPEDGLVFESAFMGASHSSDTVLVHEMGHYLGLYHTFEGGCTNNNCLTDGDEVCDTPPDNSIYFSDCDTTNSCNTDTLSGFSTDQIDLSSDYMDYSIDTCYKAFTQGQSDKMNWNITNVRSSLLNCKSCITPCENQIIASITAPSLNSITIPINSTLSFTATANNTNIYEWNVDEDPAFDTTLNTTYTFNTEGIYTVNFLAKSTNPIECKDATDSITVIVECTPQTSSFATLTSAANTDNQLVNLNSAITNISYTISGAATGLTVSGLPPGVTGNLNNGVLTISGTPIVNGTYNYTIMPIGDCPQNVTGTINVGSECIIGQNNGFENPEVIGQYPDFPHENEVPDWTTTAPDKIIEIWPDPNFEGSTAFEGNQFAELNANYSSTLIKTFTATANYQTILSFAHRGRLGTDVMAVEVGPSGGPYESLGTFSDGNSEWGFYQIPYTTTVAGTYELRFVSVSSVGGPSVGNFLDAVDPGVSNVVSAIEIPPKLGCDNSSTLTLDGTASSFGTDITYQWTTLDGNIVSGFNSNSAIIDKVGTYNLTVSNGAAGCIDTSSVTVQKGSKTASISYSKPEICKNSSLSQEVMQTGDTGGIYSALPSGLTIDSNSGTIIPSSSDEGIYTITYTLLDTDNCEGYSTTTTVEILNYEIPIFISIAPIVCKDSSPPPLPHSSINGINGTWDPPFIDNTSSGSYVFTPSIGQCAKNKTIQIIVKENIEPSFNIPSNICKNDVAPILPNTSNEGITGSWSPPIVSDTITDIYTFTPNSNQCAHGVSKTITVNNPIANITQDASICYGDNTTITITGTPNSEVTFNVNNSTTQTISLDATGVANINSGILSDTTIYNLEHITTNECSIAVSGSVTITVVPLPSSGIETPLTVCTSDKYVNLRNGLLGEDNNGVWSDDNNTGALSGNYFNASLVQTGTYKFTYSVYPTTICLDPSKTTVNVTVIDFNPIISGYTVIDNTFNNSIQITLEGNNENANSYEYAIDENEGYQDSPKFENVKGGVHTLFVRDKWGCSQDQMSVCIVYFPPYFTPNNDGYKDLWHGIGISSKCFKSAEGLIFDRYGKVLYKFNPLSANNFWNGMYNGVEAITNDYWYYVKLSDYEGHIREERGHFTLKR